MQIPRHVFRLRKFPLVSLIKNNARMSEELLTNVSMQCGGESFASRNISRLLRPVSLNQCYSTKKFLTNDDVRRSVEEISDNFQEAMELLDDARASIGTIYFTDDMNDAESAISKVVNDYEVLLQALNEEQRRNVIRTIGLKMEELKSQAEMVKESMKDK